jgi:hypothetical protein
VCFTSLFIISRYKWLRMCCCLIGCRHRVGVFREGQARQGVAAAAASGALPDTLLLSPTQRRFPFSQPSIAPRGHSLALFHPPRCAPLHRAYVTRRCSDRPPPAAAASDCLWHSASTLESLTYQQTQVRCVKAVILACVRSSFGELYVVKRFRAIILRLI